MGVHYFAILAAVITKPTAPVAKEREKWATFKK